MGLGDAWEARFGGPQAPGMGAGTTVAAAVALAAAGTATYVFGFIFIQGAMPAQDEFMNATCAASGLWRMLNVLWLSKAKRRTVLTWGYTKATVRRFLRFYATVLFPQPQACLGKLAPDAALVPLSDPTAVLSLKRDYVDVMAPGMPLVLNMGSLT